MAEPKIGLSGVDRIAETAACTKSIAEWGTLNGWANAWKADPHVICHGAMYVTMNFIFSRNSYTLEKLSP